MSSHICPQILIQLTVEIMPGRIRALTEHRRFKVEIKPGWFGLLSEMLENFRYFVA